MTDPQPVNTEWVVVAHKRFPFAEDVVIGHYPDVSSAQAALNGILANPQWFTNYSIEHRNLGG